jgi:hypothetical protein
MVQKKNFQSLLSIGKGKFDGKNKVSHSTNFKKKPDKKKGACHICGEPDHWVLITLIAMISVGMAAIPIMLLLMAILR